MTMRVLLHIYILLSPGIMDILVDVIYVKLDITDDVQDNIPDDPRRSVCSKSESKATNEIIKDGVCYTTSI